MSDHKREGEPNTSETNRRRIDDDIGEEQQPKVMDEKAPNQLAIGELHAVILQFKNEIVASIKESHAKSIEKMKKIQDDLKTEFRKEIAAIKSHENEMRERTAKMKQLEAKKSKDKIPPQIFKLDVDCVQEVFDYLSVQDIRSVSNTCTRMQRIAFDYFETNLKALELQNKYGEFKIPHSNVYLNEFAVFVQKLQIGERLVDEDYLSMGLYCKSLKQIRFDDKINLNAIRIHYLKPILRKIETISFQSVHNSYDDFNDEFLKFCPNIRELCLNNRIESKNNEWLLRSYPTLEHLQLHFDNGYQATGFTTFFAELPARNPSLRKLSMNGHTLLAYIDVMLQGKIKLQTLIIDIRFDSQAETLCHHLIQLHNQGFYQQLHLRCETDQRLNGIIATLNSFGLEKLYLRKYSNKFCLDSLTNIKEIGLCFGIEDSVNLSFYLQSIANKLVNVERLYLHRMTSEMFEKFIKYSAKLEAIKINWLDEAESINLSVLNKEREKLAEAKKVTIYLNEVSFLAAKWNNETTNYKMIELKRAESYDWQYPFSIE